MRLVVAGTLVKSRQAQATAGEHELSAVPLRAIGLAALGRLVETVGRLGAEPDLDRVDPRVDASSFDESAGHPLTDATAGQP